MKVKLLKFLLIFSIVFTVFVISPLSHADDKTSGHEADTHHQETNTPTNVVPSDNHDDIDYSNITVNTSRDFTSQDAPNRKIREVTIVHHDAQPAVNRAQSADVCYPSTTTPTTFGLTGWKLTGNVVYRLNPNSAPSGLGSVLPKIAGNATGTWMTATGSNVIFIRGANTSVNRSRYDRQNVIAWGRLANGTLGLTTTRYYIDTGQVVDVDTILNNRVNWVWNNPASINPDNVCGSLIRYDSQNILTHELGHWLGLDDRYDPGEKDLTMYGYGSKGELKKDTLNSGDITGIHTLYP